MKGRRFDTTRPAGQRYRDWRLVRKFARDNGIQPILRTADWQRLSLAMDVLCDGQSVSWICEQLHLSRRPKIGPKLTNAITALDLLILEERHLAYCKPYLPNGMYLHEVTS